MANEYWNMVRVKGKCISFSGDAPVREDYEVSLKIYIVMHPELQAMLVVTIQKRKNSRDSKLGIKSEYEPVKEYEVALSQGDHYLKYDDEEYLPRYFVSLSLFRKLELESYCDVEGVNL